MTVAIVTQDYDPTVDPVIEHLRDEKVRVVRFDLSDFPSKMTVVSNDFTGEKFIDVRNRRLDLDDVQSVWYRRPTDFDFGDEMAPHERRFAEIETICGVGGIFRSMECLWVNRPEVESVASLKPYQLHLARQCGLNVPRTLLTNDPEYVRSLLQAGEDLIYKLLGPGLIQRPGEMPVMVLTTPLDEIEDEELDRVRFTPCLLQERVPKAYEVRLTAIGDAIVPVSIDSQSDEAGRDDWRGANQLTYGPPPQIDDTTLDATMKLLRSLDLVYAAVDFIVTPAGDWLFLEANPAGQFIWLEEELGIPLAAEMADLLRHGVSGVSGIPRILSYEL